MRNRGAIEAKSSESLLESEMISFLRENNKLSMRSFYVNYILRNMTWINTRLFGQAGHALPSAGLENSIIRCSQQCLGIWRAVLLEVVMGQREINVTPAATFVRFATKDAAVNALCDFDKCTKYKVVVAREKR